MTSEALLSTGGKTRSLEVSRARGGLSAVDYLTLFLIGLVVVLLSLPRLRRFALRENELDAIALLQTLGADMPECGQGLSAGGLAGLLAANPRHENRFEDLELLPDGRLRRHGYLFDAQETRPGQWVLRGWPWEHGHTGLGAFVFSPALGMLGNANETGASDGPNHPPGLPELGERAGGWRSLPH